ncbi:MAG: hypothetical protein ACJ8F7_11530 [Gemmataceae bacterium]
MSRTIRWGLLTVSLLCLPVAVRAGDDKKNDPPASYTTVGDVPGVIESADGSSVTLRQSQYSVQRSKTKGNQVKENHQDVKFELAPDCKIRMKHLPPLTDEKGNKKQRTPEELQKLKGNSNLPGYAAEASDLKAGQIVTLHLVKMKGEKDAKPMVARIIIEGEAPAAPQSDNKKKSDK